MLHIALYCVLYNAYDMPYIYIIIKGDSLISLHDWRLDSHTGSVSMPES